MHEISPQADLRPVGGLRPLVIRAAPADASAASAPATASTLTPAPATFSKPPKPQRTGTRRRYIKWAELLRLTFGPPVDACLVCGKRMELRALGLRQ